MDRWYEHLAVADEQRKDALRQTHNRQLKRAAQSDKSGWKNPVAWLLNDMNRWVKSRPQKTQSNRAPQLRAQRAKD